MAARDVLKNFNLFVDGRGQAGQVEEFTPPVLELIMEEFRAAGMNAAVELEMGMEKLEANFSLISFDRDVLALFGVSAGQSVRFIMRGALESWDGTVKAISHTMSGRIKKIDSGTSKAGDKPSMQIDIALDYYKLTHSGEVVHEIDVINMVRVVNGVDVLASQRAALGM
jgi:P2 family phage contractile tail tube protein